ncbi:hypothetical protein [Nonlabens xiamenensis]|uniref:hypothetical protein n=1 Tax=Nonlabens xiamenensis TaxID=2341043 RepID=UPI000F61416B|nr:hypothetical protein [Nonlabens xiamenensis]
MNFLETSVYYLFQLFVQPGAFILLFFLALTIRQAELRKQSIEIFRLLLIISFTLHWIYIGIQVAQGQDWVAHQHLFGEYAVINISLLVLRLLSPLILFQPIWGRKPVVLGVIALFMSCNYWMEVMTITISSFHRDYISQDFIWFEPLMVIGQLVSFLYITFVSLIILGISWLLLRQREGVLLKLL